MEISFDPAKRARTLAERGLDFADASEIFAAIRVDVPDDRFAYDEERMITYGWLGGRAVAVVWVERFGRRCIISMRHMHDEERLDVGLDRP